jgi:hypothetical protein
MSDQQPELRWAPIPPAPKRGGRIWLIIGLSVLAVAIIVTLLFLFLPRGGAAEPTPSPTTSPSPSASASSSPTPEPSATDTPEITPPPVDDPDLETFTALVQPRLDDAQTGLGFLAGMSGAEAAQVVDSLQQDAEVLSDSVAPSSIAAQWSDAVSDYTSSLVALRSAIDGGNSTTAPLDAATNALQKVRALVGL